MHAMNCISVSQLLQIERVASEETFSSLEEEGFLSSEAMSLAGSPKNLCHWPQEGALPSRAVPCSASLTCTALLATTAIS